MSSRELVELLTGISAACCTKAVADQQWQDLGSTVAALATDSILVQQRLDAGVAASREQFAALLATLPESARSLLLPLAPPGIVVTEYRVRCELNLTTTRAVGLSLVVAPLNAGYSALYGTTSCERSSFTIEVLAVPAQASFSPPPKG